MFLTFTAAVLVFLGGYYFGNLSSSKHQKLLQATQLPEPRPLQNFDLMSFQGPFTKDQLIGKWSFLYFGYTYCPDICPATLTYFTQIQNRLSNEQELLNKTQFIMISVDPERDHPTRLQSYVSHFNPDFIGVTGNKQNIDLLTKELGIFYKIHPPDEHGNYAVDHSSAVLLIDPQGRETAVYTALLDAKAAAEDFRLIATSSN